MTILVTGAAGFIGFHVSQRLLQRDIKVIAVDNLNNYYDVGLKRARLHILSSYPQFSFIEANIADATAMTSIGANNCAIRTIIHLAAQAGVQYSLQNPLAYAESNLVGQVTMLEMARRLPKCDHFVYASSSSVYGSNAKLPFSVEDRVDHPLSLYAATKRSCELISHTYSHLFSIPTTGLRLFTVYGPWGRPDMSAFIFVKAVLEGKPIRIFNDGNMARDFTYIDDIVTGILSVADHAPTHASPPYRIFNIGNNKPEPLMRFLAVIEKATGRSADVIFQPMRRGDVQETFADIGPISEVCGFSPTTSIDVGVPEFVRWYRSFYCI